MPATKHVAKQTKKLMALLSLGPQLLFLLLITLETPAWWLSKPKIWWHCSVWCLNCCWSPWKRRSKSKAWWQCSVWCLNFLVVHHLGDARVVAIDVDPLRGESAGVLLVPHDREEVTTLVDLHLKIEKKRGIKNGPQTVFTLCRFSMKMVKPGG